MLQRCALKTGVVPNCHEPEKPGFVQSTERRRQSQTLPPDPEWIEVLRRFGTGRPLCAVALSNYPSDDYGLAGGAIAGDASAAGDAIAPLSVVAALW